MSLQSSAMQIVDIHFGYTTPLPPPGCACAVKNIDVLNRRKEVGGPTKAVVFTLGIRRMYIEDRKTGKTKNSEIKPAPRPVARVAL